jgi:hypothetical protein
MQVCLSMSFTRRKALCFIQKKIKYIGIKNAYEICKNPLTLNCMLNFSYIIVHNLRKMTSNEEIQFGSESLIFV